MDAFIPNLNRNTRCEAHILETIVKYGMPIMNLGKSYFFNLAADFFSLGDYEKVQEWRIINWEVNDFASYYATSTGVVKYNNYVPCL